MDLGLRTATASTFSAIELRRQYFSVIPEHQPLSRLRFWPGGASALFSHLAAHLDILRLQSTSKHASTRRTHVMSTSTVVLLLLFKWSQPQESLSSHQLTIPRPETIIIHLCVRFTPIRFVGHKQHRRLFFSTMTIHYNIVFRQLFFFYLSKEILVWV